MLCGVAFILCTAVEVWCLLPPSSVERLLCGIAPILFVPLAVWCCSISCTTVAVWHFSYPVYSACCVVLHLSYVQRLLCGLASSACCMVLLLCYLQRMLCGIAPIPFTAPAVWFCVYLVYSVCCVALHGFALNLFFSACCVVLLIAYLMFSGCCVALPLSCLKRLLCGFAPVVFAAFAVWCCFYLMYSGFCVALPRSCLQRLLCGMAPILITALAV